jgi:hypothetical protein
MVFSPNRELRSFDITPHVDGNQEFIYLKMENPVPDNAAGEEKQSLGTPSPSSRYLHW